MKFIKMSFNLPEAIKGLFTNEVVHESGTQLGEPDAKVSRAFSGMIPVVLGTLLENSTTAEGAQKIAQVSAEQYQSGIPGNIPGSSISTHGSIDGVLSGLFGNKLEKVTNLLAGFAGIKTSSVHSLLGMAVPVVLGFLGKYSAENNLNASGLASFMHSQEGNIRNAVPAGLNLASVYGVTEEPVIVATHDSHVLMLLRTPGK